MSTVKQRQYVLETVKALLEGGLSVDLSGVDLSGMGNSALLTDPYAWSLEAGKTGLWAFGKLTARVKGTIHIVEFAIITKWGFNMGDTRLMFLGPASQRIATRLGLRPVMNAWMEKTWREQ